MAVPQSVLITGANRGIGLGLVHAYLKLSGVKHVFGTARDPAAATEFASIKDPRFHALKMDVLCDESVKKAAEETTKILGSDGLNLLINNSGIFEKYDVLETPDRKTLNKVIEVNATSQLIVTQFFLPLLRKAAASTSVWGIQRAAVIMMSSGAASIVDNTSGSKFIPAVAYRMSKAALNQLMKTLAVDFEPHGILVASIAPGHVATDMGGKNADITVDESCSAMLDTFSKWKKEHSGGFFRRNGDPFPF
ncbi:unnamed protein product, partial [Mesorhabditis belari]|uniref:Uncharacterized protein n=1 Tax=Mesorhabditis belari TaxID=2138241 RepID=A0AAF3JAH0_9BILA